MLTQEHLDTAAVYGCDKYPALRQLGWSNAIQGRQHALRCCKEVEAILTETTVIDGVAVKTDWMKNLDEMTALIHLAATCAYLGA